MVGERRACAIRNAAFAEAFTAANQGRVVTDDVRARQQRRAGAVSVIGLAVLVLVWWLVTTYLPE